MLRQEIERCPDDVWLSGEHPRGTWRIVYHALFYAHFYLQPSADDFVPWTKGREHVQYLTGSHEPPHELPPEVEPYSKADLLEYWSLIDGSVDETVDGLDLEATECGFWWYKMAKLDHQFMNVRHIQQHVGQLSERLYAAGVDLSWIGG